MRIRNRKVETAATMDRASGRGFNPEMFKTLDRYVIREILPPFILSVLIFTFILELPPIMQNLERLVAKGVPWQTAGRILLLLMPQALGLTIPMGLLVGIL